MDFVTLGVTSDCLRMDVGDLRMDLGALGVDRGTLGRTLHARRSGRSESESEWSGSGY